MRERGVIERAFLCAIGALDVVEEKVGSFISRLEERGERKEKELAARLREVRGRRPSLFGRCLRDILRAMDVPTASDIRRVEERIFQIEQLLREKGEEGTGKQEN